MKLSRNTEKTKDPKDKLPPIIEIIEFTNPVEISGDGEYLYITEIDSKTGFVKKVMS